MAAFLTDYVAWHYGQALRDMTEVWKNFLWFGYHFFSVKLLAKTLFSPLYRIKEPYRGLDIEPLLESLVLNSLTRFIGFLLRSFVILAGLVFEIIIAVSFIPALLFWIFLPAVLTATFIWGMILTF